MNECGMTSAGLGGLDSISPLVVFVVLVAIIIFIHLPFTPHSAQFLAIIKSGLSGCVSGLCLWLWAMWAVGGCRTVDYSGEECDDSFVSICDETKDDRDNKE